MAGNPRVIHTAQALVDEVVEIAGLPRRGQNAMARSYTRYAGGAVNILLAAARSGAECLHAGAHGTGPNGDLVRKVLRAEGIRLSSPIVPDADTGICFVMIEPSAERTFVTTMGAERRITVESLQTCAPAPGDLVCVSGYSLLDPTRKPLQQWLDTVPEGVVVVLDPGAAFADLPEDVRARALGHTPVWTSNAEEAEALTGVADFRESAVAMAAHLPDGATVIVRDGPKGCVVSEGGQSTYVEGFPQIPLDTNGAGDTHTGVLCACRAAGGAWIEAARRANAAGAIKVTRRGPATAPAAREIDAFLASE
jgi:sugar/nucleoside kinase (ribokinase family)